MTISLTTLHVTSLSAPLSLQRSFESWSVVRWSFVRFHFFVQACPRFVPMSNAVPSFESLVMPEYPPNSLALDHFFRNG